MEGTEIDQFEELSQEEKDNLKQFLSKSKNVDFSTKKEINLNNKTPIREEIESNKIRIGQNFEFNKMDDLKDNSIEKLKISNIKNEEICNKIKQLENEIKILSNKLIEKEKEIQLLKSNENDYNNKIKQYENEIQKLKKDNNDLSNNIRKNDNKDKIISLMEELRIKENEIKELKSKFPFDLKEGEKLTTIIFSSIEEDIYYTIICKNTDKFNKIENMFYDAYPQYLVNENYFTVKGNKIIKSKTIEQNNIKYGDIIIINN